VLLEALSFSVPLGDPVPLLDKPEQWGTWHHHEHPPALDGRMTLLRTIISAPHAAVLRFREIGDRTSVFLDGQPVGVLLSELNDRALSLRDANGELTIFVEDLGGGTGLAGVTLDGRPVTGWDVMPLHLGRPVTVRPDRNVPVSGPVFRRATFVHDEPGELVLDTSAWGCGVVWMNGHDLGRYWSRTPRPLHVPREALKAGVNELVVLETGVPADHTARFHA
jgi:beta-galactosidase